MKFEFFSKLIFSLAIVLLVTILIIGNIFINELKGYEIQYLNIVFTLVSITSIFLFPFFIFSFSNFVEKKLKVKWVFFKNYRIKKKVSIICMLIVVANIIYLYYTWELPPKDIINFEKN